MENAMMLMGKNFIIYAFFIVLFPGILVRVCFPEKKKNRWFLVSYLLGNFIVINVVYILAFLKIYNRNTFLITYFLVLGIVFFWNKRTHINEWNRNIENFKDSWEHGSISLKLIFRKIFSDTLEKFKRNRFAGIWLLLEAVSLCLIIAFFLEAVGYRVVALSSFTAPDEEVHLQWIQSLLGNRLFHSGIYPFGMHNVISAISLVGNITAAEAVKYFGVLTNVWSILTIYCIFKEFHKNSWAILIGLAVVFTTNLFPGSSISRFVNPVPHETALFFMYTIALFLLLYLKENNKRYLVYFGMTFTTTLLFHFHITIMAGIFCVCVGIIFFVYAFKRKQIGMILLCGVLASCAGAWPVAVGLLEGYPFEQSMAWAVSVIDKSMPKDEEEEADTDESEQKEAQEVDTGKKKEGILDKIEDTVELLFSEQAYEEFMHYTYEELGYTYEFIDGDGDKGEKQFKIVMVFYAIAVILAVCRTVMEKFSVEMKARWVFYLMYFVLYIMMVSDIIKIPILLYPSRLISYIPFFTAFVIAGVFEELYCIFERFYVVEEKGPVVTAALAFSVLACVTMFPEDVKVEHATSYYFQTKGANQAVSRILNTYDNHTWTVVSTVTETSMVYREGYHYEWLNFINALQNREDIYIPTPYVFFVIEKKPITQYGSYFTEYNPIFTQRKDLVIAHGYRNLKSEKSESEYYINQREVIMAKAMLWVRSFKKQYPRDMDVYYEDSEVVVYRLKQNQAYNNLNVKQ